MGKTTPLAEWVYRFRIHLDLTQSDFARLMTVSLPTVSRWEAGTRTPGGPVLLLLARMADESGFAPPPDVDTKRGPRRPKGVVTGA